MQTVWRKFRHRYLTLVLAAVLLVHGVAAGPLVAADTGSGIERQRLAMLAAAEAGDVGGISRLITAGATVTAADEALRTPLYMAVLKNRLEAVKLLLAEGANINAQARDMQTPWLLAASLGHVETLRLMLPHKPDAKIFDRLGDTALSVACEGGHGDVVRLMLATGIDPNHANTLGWTCLIEIGFVSDGSAKFQEIARMVIKAGGDPRRRDGHGKQAIDYATARGLTALAAVLRGHTTP